MTDKEHGFSLEPDDRPARRANEIITVMNDRIENALTRALDALDVAGIGDGTWRATAICFELRNFISMIEDGQLSHGRPKKDGP